MPKVNRRAGWYALVYTNAPSVLPREQGGLLRITTPSMVVLLHHGRRTYLTAAEATAVWSHIPPGHQLIYHRRERDREERS